MDMFAQNKWETSSAAAYCFIQSSDPKVLDRVEFLGLPEIASVSSASGVGLFCASHGVAKPLIISVINDIGDWTVPDFSRLDSYDPRESVSLLSCASLQKKTFGCCTDIWGIHPHYWYKSEDTFLCGNNLFLVAHLCNADIDNTSLDEYLFFLSPQEDRTLFKDIKILLPGQSLRFQTETESLSLSVGYAPADQLLKYPEVNLDYVGIFLDFFCKAQKRLDNTSATVGLSSGTDSTTILASLRWAGADIKTCSFGMPHYFESQRAQALCKKLNISGQLVSLMDSDQWWQRLKELTFWSSGLVNPYRLHYGKFYDAIPCGEALFEGTLGSQFVKGDFPLGSAISEGLAFLFLRRGSLGQAVKSTLAGLPNDVLIRVKHTVQNSPAVDLLNSQGSSCPLLRSYLLNNTAQRLFSGPLVLAARRLKLYLPYLHQDFLRHLFQTPVHSFYHKTSLEGPVPFGSKIMSLAQIVGKADKEVDAWVLGNRLSFREVRSLPNYILRYLQVVRKIFFHNIKYRGAFFEQIDNLVAFRSTTSLLRENTAPWGNWSLDKASIRLKMCAANLVVVKKVQADLAQGWKPWMEN